MEKFGLEGKEEALEQLIRDLPFGKLKKNSASEMIFSNEPVV